MAFIKTAIVPTFPSDNPFPLPDLSILPLLTCSLVLVLAALFTQSSYATHVLHSVLKGRTVMTMNESKPDGPTGDFNGDIEVSDKLPSKGDLEKVANLPVLDASGKSLPFKTLHSNPGGISRVLIIFIRHFFCGVSNQTDQLPN